MDYRELKPARSLRPFVRCYWILCTPALQAPAPQRILPDGCVEVIVNLGAPFVRHDHSRTERQPLTLLVGPTTRHMSIAATGDVRLVGVRFGPGGAYPFLAVSAAEVRDTAPSLADITPAFARDLAERLADAPPGTEAAVLDRALGGRLARAARVTDPRVLASVQATFAAERPLRVDALVALTGLGARQIERTFREAVGYSPKTLCRLTRFQRIVRTLERETRPSWAQLAATHGYADQSHLAREFREYAGTTLTQYLGELHPMSDRFHSGALTEEMIID